MLSEKNGQRVKNKVMDFFLKFWSIGLRPYMALDDPSIRLIGPIIGRVFNHLKNTRLIAQEGTF